MSKRSISSISIPKRRLQWQMLIYSSGGTRLRDVAEQSPSNIFKYYGYLEKEGRIAGLCFERHDMTLRDAKRNGVHLDIDQIVKGVESGLDHLHRLGIVHVCSRYDFLMNQLKPLSE